MADQVQCSTDPRCLVVVHPRFDLGLEICSEDLVTGLDRPEVGLARPETVRPVFCSGCLETVPGHLGTEEPKSGPVRTATDLGRLVLDHLEIEDAVFE